VIYALVVLVNRSAVGYFLYDFLTLLGHLPKVMFY